MPGPRSASSVWRAAEELRLMTGGTRAVKELSLRDYKFYSKLIPLCFAVSLTSALARPPVPTTSARLASPPLMFPSWSGSPLSFAALVLVLVVKKI